MAAAAPRCGRRLGLNEKAAPGGTAGGRYHDRMTRALRRRISGWLIAVLLFGTLSATLGAAFASTSPDFGDAGQVCSAGDGPGLGGPAAPGQPATPFHGHCVFCSINALGLGLPSQGVPIVPIGDTGFAAPRRAACAVRRQTGFTRPPPRAPPLA